MFCIYQAEKWRESVSECAEELDGSSLDKNKSIGDEIIKSRKFKNRVWSDKGICKNWIESVSIQQRLSIK